LEDRVTPSTTNVSISIMPNLASRTVTETLTATVTPTGSETGPATGTVCFNLNNQTAVACVDSNNQATAAFSLPMFAILSGQTAQAVYTPDSASLLSSSSFLSPVYLNPDNVLFAANIVFGSPSPDFTGFNSALGEMNTVQLFALPVTFTYTDPGTITSVSTLGFTFPGVFSTLFINPFAATALTTASFPATSSITLASSFAALSSSMTSSSPTPM
jgi:hypothetical protein